MAYTSTSAAVPILPSSDLERSRAFYAFLGFAVLDSEADYLRVGHDDVEVHLYPSPDLDPRANPCGWYLKAAEPAELLAEVDRRRAGMPGRPAPAYYGPTLFALVDPDGNMLRVGPLPG